MKTTIKLLIILVLFLGTSAVLAQQNGERARLAGAIEKTDEILIRAGEAVRESGSDRARNQLEMAVKLQGMARQLANQVEDNPIGWSDLVVKAGKYTLSARDKAQRAIAITRQAVENEDYVKRRLEKTDDLIRRIEEKVGDEAPQGLLLMLGTAHDKQQRAVEFYRNRRLKASLQLTMQVEKSLKEAADRVGGYQKTRNRYERQEDRYYKLRERIELSGYGDQPEIRRNLENAERLKAQADEIVASGGQYSQAEKAMQEAIEIMTRVSEEQREPAKIRMAIDDAGNMAGELSEMVDRFGDSEIKRQYRTALDHLEKASNQYDREDYEGAAAQVQAANQILSRIAKVVEEPVLIEHGLEILRAQASNMEARVAASGNRLIQKEFSEANEFLARGSALYNKGDYKAAAGQLETAERMLARIAHSLGE